nr:sphingomyelin phosphodiesterase 4 isoform X2 [Parasteatoda tepidariorum]
MNKFQIALSSPILTERCFQITQLLQDAPLKEVQYIFPGVIENIFGVRSGIDWGFLKLDKNTQSRDFDSLRKLLAPDGPILKLVYKFTEDVSPKFEFPFSWLPVPSQLMLQEGKVPGLYVNKLQISGQNIYSSSLQLNSLEFYFFHFCYYIVNPVLKNITSTVNQQDTLYAHILEDYLAYFLPTENRTVPLFQAQNAQHSPILTSSLSSNFGSSHASPESRHSFNANNRDFLGPATPKPSLLKKDIVMMVTSPGSDSSSGFGTSASESWRSETFILVLKEMLLNQNSTDHHQQNIHDLIPKTFIPTHYHVWMVRILVKHLHFFFNSTLSPNQTTGHGQIMIDSLGRLKSLGMTSLIQKEIYSFLKTVFDHWPLDASFRVPLETYLSYIQPWRYIQCDLEPSTWQKFLTENILFYTTIFVQILRRFLRMDLSCPKNAYMLYRLTKVLCTRELRQMITQAEKVCVSKPANVGMPGFLRSSEKLFYQRMSEIEMTGSNYLPLFSEPVFVLVSQLVSSIAAARQKSSTENLSQSIVNKSFFSKFASLFDVSNDEINSDDNSPSELQKVSTYLDMSSKQLCNFFSEVVPPQQNNASLGNLSLSTSDQQSRLNNSGDTSEKFSNLKAINRMLVLNQNKKQDVEYHDNPDLQPVRTYEVGFLVKVLNEISQQINEKYGSEIEQLYFKNTLVGKMCRRLVAAPVTYINVIKSKDMMSVSSYPVHLPPRVCLRFLSHKQLLAYIFIFLFLNYFLSSSPIFGIFVFTLLLFVLLFLSALFYPVEVHPKDD